METTIQKWGNSLAVRLPKEVTRKLALRPGSRVRVYEEKKEVIIVPTREKEKSLKEMIAEITPENLHSETDWGDARGREVW
ncbi:MAG: AbrB/MazE/SpoVT family DNA-binding domain-containing protein [Patescibacteria group bacterium]